VNLEEPKGMAHNPFSVLSSSEISEIASDTEIVLGNEVVDKLQPILEIVDKDRDRKVRFESTCTSCQVDDKVEIIEPLNLVGMEEMSHVLLKIRSSDPRRGTELMKRVSGP
jgi:hypothetical protein